MGWMRLDYSLSQIQPPGLTLSTTFEKPERRGRGPGETMVTEAQPLGRHPPSGLQTTGTVHGKAGRLLEGGADRGQVAVDDSSPAPEAAGLGSDPRGPGQVSFLLLPPPVQARQFPRRASEPRTCAFHSAEPNSSIHETRNNSVSCVGLGH